MADPKAISPGPWVATKAGMVRDSEGQPVAAVMRVADLPAIAAASELLQALQRLSATALARDSTMGDQCRLLQVRAELAEANKHAMAAIAKATEAL